MVEIQKPPSGRSAERAWLNAFHALAELTDDAYLEAKALLQGPRSPDAVRSIFLRLLLSSRSGLRNNLVLRHGSQSLKVLFQLNTLGFGRTLLQFLVYVSKWTSCC